MPHGKLTVVVEGATDIKSSGVYGRGSSYCTLACGSQVFSSPTVEGGSNPLFKTAFEFEIDRTTNELNVCVYCKDSTSRDDELAGFCTLNFKKVFFYGHTVPLTAYPIQQPSGNPGGKVNISFNFKMRPSPNGHNTHAPTRCSPPPPRVAHNILGRQSLPVDWGYDCHEASEAKIYRRTRSDPPIHQENYLNYPGAASDNSQGTTPHRHHESYLKFPGTASYNHHETKPSFIRYGNPTKLRPESPQTPNYARPSPMTEYNKPFPAKPLPQVKIQPQVPMQVKQRPSVLAHLGGEAVNGLAEGVGGELANQVMGGVGQFVLDTLCNF